MDNYLLFKQAVCLIWFFETLVLWPRFDIYFGPQVFPKSLFTTPFRIHAFHLLLLTTLIFLFLNCYSLAASFILFLCMRYLFVSGANSRIATFGAVGHICFVTAAYLFFFEAAFVLDPSHTLALFIQTVLAIEIGIIMLSSGVHKYFSGYLHESGFEYALVNPSWGKFFFFFKKLKPSSWFFKVNNYAAVSSELLIGLFFFLPQTRIFGAYLLLITFLYVFLTVRVNILPLLMMSLTLLYIKPIAFHFPILNEAVPQFVIPEAAIQLIKAIFILYLALYILITLVRMLQMNGKVAIPTFLIKPMRFFIRARPCFEWSVFTFKFTHFFIKITKVSKRTKTITATLFDGFSKNYRELFDDPRLFFRFIHHHEASFLLNIFAPLSLARNEEMEWYLKLFIQKIGMYVKSFVSESELEDTVIVFTLMHIKKGEDAFFYSPVMNFFVDVKSGEVLVDDS